MSSPSRLVRVVQRIVAIVAALFGVATLVAGSRVLAGADPGYAVFRPLVIFNTAMGVAYLAAAIAAWRDVRLGRNVAGAVFAVNLVGLGVTLLLHRAGQGVAMESLRAMGFRTAVWLGLFLVLSWSSREPSGRRAAR